MGEGLVGVEIVASLIRKLDETKTLRDQLVGAAADVEAERASVSATNLGEEQRIELARQNREAATLLKEILHAQEAFIESIVEIRAPLRAAAQIAERIRKEYPLLTLPPVPTLENFGTWISESWPDDWQRNAGSRTWGSWLENLLLGPVRSASSASNLTGVLFFRE